MSHIKALLVLADSTKGTIRGYDEVRFSIWYHDAIYNTRRGDNEEKSAQLAAESLAMLKARLDTIAAVRDMILATKDHEAANYSDDAQMFLDMDLSILGAPDAVYREYSKAIRSEYAWVPEFMYRRERRKILAGFLARATVYLTEVMRNRFEMQARINLDQELQALSAGTI